MSANTRNKITFIRTNILVFVLIVISGMILLTSRSDTLNYDEFFSMSWSRMDWGDYISRLMADTHPPFHDILLKVLNDISGGNVYVARLLSASFAISLFWISGLFLKKHFGTKVAVFFVTFLYMNNLMIQKSTEIRMYSLATLLCLLNAMFFYLLIKNPERKYWIGFTISGVLAAYTQFFGILCMCFTYVGVLLYFFFRKEKREIRNWFLASIATIVAYLPWVAFAFGQVAEVSKDFWIEMPTSKLGPLREMFTTKYAYSYYLYFAVLVFLTVVSIIDFIKNKTAEAFWSAICSITLWGVYIIAYAFSYFIQPILVSRYLLMGFAITLLGSCIQIRKFNKYVIVPVLLAVSFLGSSVYFQYFKEQFNKNTTAFELYAEHNIEPEDEVYFIFRNYEHYFEHWLQYYVSKANIIGFETKDELLNQIKLSAEASNGKIWVVDFENEIGSNVLADDNFTDMGKHYISTQEFKLYSNKKY